MKKLLTSLGYKLADSGGPVVEVPWQEGGLFVGAILHAAVPWSATKSARAMDDLTRLIEAYDATLRKMAPWRSNCVLVFGYELGVILGSALLHENGWADPATASHAQRQWAIDRASDKLRGNNQIRTLGWGVTIPRPDAVAALIGPLRGGQRPETPDGAVAMALMIADYD